MDLRINIDAKSVIKNLNKVIAEHPKAVAFALNKTAFQVREAEMNEIKNVFDRPTPFTIKAVEVIKAYPNRLYSKIKLRDFAGKGIPASVYLRPQIIGGGRELKRFERRLKESNKLPAGYFVVPGRGAKLNKYGNISQGQIVQILSLLGTFGNLLGAQMNVTRESRKRNKRLPNIFLISPGHHRLPPGIWERKSNSIRSILLFVKNVHYKKRLKFFEVAKEMINKTLIKNIQDAINFSLKGTS